MTDFPMVDVLELKPIEGSKLWLRFTDGYESISDLSELVSSGGPMVAPLRKPEYFDRAFVELGAPTWPNGFDLDPINLYMKMKQAGLLEHVSAA